MIDRLCHCSVSLFVHAHNPCASLCPQVNYGKPFKMNTVEAMAATLYIAGLKDDAVALLEPFAFGEEFIKINLEALNAYASCTNADEVRI
jgi:pre-rRNA-processing protein TSR3